MRYIEAMLSKKSALASITCLTMLASGPAWAQDGEVVETESLSGGSTSRRGSGASWDMLFGSIPRGALLQAELGFSALPRVAYHHTLSDSLSIGGMFSFDYGLFAPRAAVTASLFFQAPIRLSLLKKGPLSAGLRFDPGLGFTFTNGFTFDLLLHMGGSVGYAVTNQFIIGGGIDLPVVLAFPEIGNAGLLWPILFGPMVEFHVTPALALTGDLKFGPWINTNGGATFGFKFHAGIAYRL